MPNVNKVEQSGATEQRNDGLIPIYQAWAETLLAWVDVSKDSYDNSIYINKKRTVYMLPDPPKTD